MIKKIIKFFKKYIEKEYKILVSEVTDMIFFGKRILQSKDNILEFIFYQKEFEETYQYILDVYKQKKCKILRIGKYNHKIKVIFSDKESAMEFKLIWM